MGHSWIFSSDLNANINYSGASQEWASSTKAELMAIITALIINNCTLWNTQKHIITTLNLQVTFIKVKAHSGDVMNDAADILAKEGSLSKDYLKINVQHLKTQTCHMIFNNNIIIDRNIRKSTKRIINFQYFDQHLKHKNLHKVKDYALDNVIDWEFSQLWFKYNSFSKPTSEQYFKHISWKIKCSNNNLLTFDILNRNYPELLENFDTCFLCSNNKETNDHLWNCSQVLTIITPIFEEFHKKFKTLITSESDSLYALYSDAITRNSVFKWTKKLPKQIQDIPDLHCLLMNFIPNSLTYPFTAAKISKTKMKKLLLNFIYELHKEIYERIWKTRSSYWKEHKRTHNITKSSFIKYRNEHHRNQNDNTYTPQHQNNLEQLNRYHCPLNDSCRQLENDNLWIYLTSSNFLHNLPWISSLNDDLSRFHSTIYNNILLHHI
ncbi:hypothetical protein RhiirA5_438002 [Rhizophagus irregularis]|uniref:Uncharacterized protein n=1 Tax=Rhizophagus irregularis TaxID=588596 RepID=A0A2N0NJQ7_9GLOM|nr:hypothetical protein RhiirA5_438002 [Rhizophagus irregularis]